MQRFFQYLDRFYVDMEAIANLSDQGFIQFRTIVFEQIMPQVNKAVLDQIQFERD